MLKSRTPCMSALIAALFFLASTAWAQDEEPKSGWELTADLSFVLTAGNAESTTLGLAAKANHYWERSRLLLAAGGIKTESALKTRFATGTVDDFQVVEEKNRQTTAENYYAAGKYEWDVGEAFFLFGSSGWTRNTFAGVEHRVLAAAGLGNTLLNTVKHSLRFNYGLTGTYQKNVVPDPSGRETFGGLRFAYDYDLAVTETSKFESDGILDDAFDNLDDIRINWLNAFTVSISSVLALKASVLLQFDNEPALTLVPLEDSSGTPTGEAVPVPLEKLDTITTLGLVVNF